MSVAVAIPNSPVFSPANRFPVNNPFLCRSASFSNNSNNAPVKPRALTHSLSFTSSILHIRPIEKPPPKVICENAAECYTSSAPVLKRKTRLAKLEIPVVSMDFGDFPATPSVSTCFEEVEGDGYSVCCKRGRRGAMEDRYSAHVNTQGNSKEGIFGVFDGHGGANAAEFAAENLSKNIMDEIERKKDEDIVEVLKSSYLKTDSEFLNQEEYRGGSCCVTALIMDGNLVVSNAGDCRAVISRGGIAEALTSDHKPSRKDEKERIEALGGYVDCPNGTWRVQGSLAVSRGIGDRSLKQWITAEPETMVLELNPELEFLVLASDGLWDKVSNQEAVDAARPLCTGTGTPQPLLACKKLVDLPVSRGSVDDISVMIIQLQQFR